MLRTLALVVCAVCVVADDIEMELQSGLLIKMLRDMVNQTKADTMNLPANATSIRENITDNFSCENRTYGYYADVDNECQVFHVCLPSQAVSGRNVTFRWSFICPAETVFNQEVLTCTRPRDAISCDDSPMYYDVNMEFGKVSNESKDHGKPQTSDNVPISNPNPNTEAVAMSPQRWNQANKKKQNIIAETFYNDLVSNTKSIKEDIKEYDSKIMDAIKEDVKKNNYNILQAINKDFSTVSSGIQDLKEEIKDIEREIVTTTGNISDGDKEKSQEINEFLHYKNEDYMNTDLRKDNMEPDLIEESVEVPQSVLKKIQEMNAKPIAPMLVEEVIPTAQEENKEDAAVDEFENSRLASERSLKRTARKMYRGSFKFRSDI